LVIASALPPLSAISAETDLLNDPLSFSGATLHLRPYVTLPSTNNDIISMTTRPGDTRLYVTTQEGTIFAVNENPNGTTTPVAWFNVATGIDQATTRFLFGNNGHDGLQSTAFHPDFANVGTPGYGKFYTTLMETRPSSTVGHNYLGSASSGNSQRDSVLVEWTYNHTTSQVDSSSYRVLFRARLPVADHMIKQARFNPYAEPGDEDYGLLYITHGDSSSQQSTEDRPQLLNNVYGKMLRINPLDPDGAGSQLYSIPATNPFAGSGDPNVLKEVFAYGFRNPHTYSFNRDDEGNIHILLGDIGRNNIEEVNLVTVGGNYGWTKREGTFAHLQGTIDVDDPLNPPPNPNAGYIYGVTNLPANEATVGVDAQGNRYVFPVAQYDHNGADIWEGKDFNATAIASGFVLRNGSDPALNNQLIFNNFSFNHGDVYHTDFDDMLGAVKQLDPNDTSRDEPGELTQAEINRLHVSLDHDSNPNTPPVTGDNLNTVLGAFRSDARFGEGVLGQMYVSTKWSTLRTVYLVTNSVPLAGDYNKDLIVDAADYIVWRKMYSETGYHVAADGNGDGEVDDDDFTIWQNNFGVVWSASGSGQAAGGGTIEVPESSTCFLAALGWIAAASRFRGKRFEDAPCIWTRPAVCY
jgi:hypothetical protein